MPYIPFRPTGTWRNLPLQTTPASAEYIEHAELGIATAQQTAEDALAAGSAGVPDGNKGDVTVSAAGTTWLVNTTHAGVTHAAVQAAAEANAATDATTKANAAESGAISAAAIDATTKANNAQANAIAAAAVDATTKADAAEADAVAFARSRPNHTGAQDQSTVTNLVSDLAAKMDLVTDQTVAPGVRKKFSHNATKAGLNLVPSVDVPSSQLVGDVWYNGVTSRFTYVGFLGALRYLLSDADIVQVLTSPAADKIPSTAAIATLPEVVGGTHIIVTPGAGPTSVVDLEPIAAAKAIPITVVATSDVSRASTTTPVADSELVIAVVANAIYEVTAYIFHDANTTADFKHRFEAPAGSTFQWAIDGLTTVATGITGDITRGTSALASNVITGGAGAGSVILAKATGILTTSTIAGNFTYLWAQGTSDAVASIRKAGSRLILRRI